MVDLNAPGRDLTRFLLPEVGRSVETGEPQDPYRLLDPAGLPVVPVTSFFALVQLGNEATRRSSAVSLGMPTFGQIATRTEIPTPLPDPKG